MAELEMGYQDMTVYRAYGDREVIPAVGTASQVYVDRQGTDEIYSSLSIAQSDNGYVVEMEIYRLGYFRGTAAEDCGMLVYTDDLVDMKGTIRYDADHAVFEVTESSSDMAGAAQHGCSRRSRRAFEIEASVKQTHTHTKSTYMQPEYACKI